MSDPTISHVEDVVETASTRRTRERSRRLAAFGILAACLVAGYQVQASELDDPVLLALGVGMIALAALPAILWARNGEKRLPAFEVMMLTGIPFYAFPLFGQGAALAPFPPAVLIRACMVVVAFQTATLLVYFAVRGSPGRSAIWRESLLPDRYVQHTRVGLFLTTSYQAIFQYTDLVPSDLASVFRALFYGIGMLSAFIQMQRWGAGLLTTGEKVFVAANIGAQIVLHVSTLYLITGASLFLLVLISYTSASRRMPLLPIVCGVAVFGLLHVGKGHMRSIHWTQDAPRVGITELPRFFSEWVVHSLAAREKMDEGVTNKLLERTSLLHVLCIVVDVVPSRQPHLNGDTYVNIPAQFVPRFFWSDKPGPHLSNIRLATYLGFVPDDEAARNVSIAFGTPSEAYTNFGLPGVLLLGGFFGFLFKKLATLTEESPPLSVGGLLMVLLMAWSLQAEMTLSVWISSLYQAAIVLVGAPVALKVLSGR